MATKGKMKAAEKSKIIKKILPPLRDRYGPVPKQQNLPLLEHLILAILNEDATEAKAQAVFERFKQEYFDWNEVRVSSVTELREVMRELPDPDNRAMRLKGTLKQIFESRYSFDIEDWRKLPHKEVTRRLGKLPASSQYIAARLIRDGMGGTTFPIDNNALRVLQRLGIARAEDTADGIALSLARIVGKNRNHEFTYLVAQLANDVCLPAEPECGKCPIADLCATGAERLRPAEPARPAKTARRAKKKAAAKAKTTTRKTKKTAK
jgi:endonuclease-3